MAMTYELQKFIEENINLIDLNTKEAWQRIYNKLEDFDGDSLPGDFGYAMYQAGIDIPEVLGYVPRRFFQNQKSDDIKNYKIPENCDYIGAFAFEDTNIESIYIPNSVKEIDFSAFAGTEISKLYIPKSVSKLANGAFMGCKDLQAVIIDSSFIDLGEDAFSNCINLEYVRIPSGIFVIESNSFKNCPNLVEIYFLGTKRDAEGFVGRPDHDIEIICADGSIIWGKDS